MVSVLDQKKKINKRKRKHCERTKLVLLKFIVGKDWPILPEHKNVFIV